MLEGRNELRRRGKLEVCGKRVTVQREASEEEVLGGKVALFLRGEKYACLLAGG